MPLSTVLILVYCSSFAFSCDAPNFSDRMILKCLSDQRLAYRLIPNASNALSRYGYTEIDKKLNNNKNIETAFILRPMLAYDPNVNGGNPKKDFEIGDAVLIGSEENVAVADLTLGLNLSTDIKKIISEGDELRLDINSYVLRSVENAYYIKKINLEACAENDLGDWTFMDFCWTGNREYRSLISPKNETLSAAFTKIYSDQTNYPSAYSLTLSNHKEDANKFSGVSLSYEGVWLEKNSFLASIKTYKSYSEELTPAWSMRTEISAFISEVPVKLELKNTHLNGGRIFGTKFSQALSQIGFSFQLKNGPTTQLTLGKVRSDLDYFNNTNVTLNFIFDNF